MINRRKFLGASLLGGTASLALASKASPLFGFTGSYAAFAAPPLQPAKDETLITILHTNDQHSQIDPRAANARNAGKGRVARRASLVKRIRADNTNTLLIDAGDA